MLPSRDGAPRGAEAVSPCVGQAIERLRRARGGPIEERRKAETALACLYADHPGQRDAIVRELMPIVDNVANRFYRGGESVEDLRQVAAIGLLKALARFDAGRGHAFIAFALPTIKGEVRRHFRDHTWALHVPRGQQELAQRVVSVARDLSATAGHQPTAEDVALVLDLDVESVVEALAAARAMRTLSLNTEAPTEGGAAASDAAQIDPGELEEGYGLVEDRLAMEQITQSLVDRDRLMLQLRFRHDLSQGAIGEHVGVSQMQVSRCLRRIFTDLEPAVADW